MNTQQKIGLAAVVVFGGILVRTLVTDRKPKIVLPPPTYVTEPRVRPPVIDQAELERLQAEAEKSRVELEKALAPRPPTPPPLPEPPPPPEKPPFRASKPGGGPQQKLEQPPDVTEPYTKAGIEAVLAAALRECPMGQLELVSTECEEFPCALVTVARDEAAKQSNLNSCSTWNEVYHGGTQYLDRTVRGTLYRIWTPLPPHEADGRIVMARSFARAKRLAAAADKARQP